MPVRSAGVLLWRRAVGSGLEVLLAHMGGPFWANKDDAAWSIPKGIHADDEEPLAAAIREFEEELGVPVPVAADRLVPLGEFRQPSGKRLTVWAAEADLDPGSVVPGLFTMEWPPRSGRTGEFPEIDRVEWWPIEIAQSKLVRGQRPLLDRLLQALPAPGHTE